MKKFKPRNLTRYISAKELAEETEEEKKEREEKEDLEKQGRVYIRPLGPYVHDRKPHKSEEELDAMLDSMSKIRGLVNGQVASGYELWWTAIRWMR